MSKVHTEIPTTQLLHHYTSISGFDGILDKNSLHMTESHFLNDPLDCRLFIELFKKYIKNQTSIKNTIKFVLKNTKYIDQAEIVTDLYTNKNCDIINFIEYIYENISLYVASFTSGTHDDELPMWDYYGCNGISISFKRDKLIDLLARKLKDDECLIESSVIYPSINDDLKAIKIPHFSGKLKGNSLKSHEKHDANGLYDTINTFEDFAKKFHNDYIITLAYILYSNEKAKEKNSNIIFKSVFNNIKNSKDNNLWKQDLTLYMITLSALIKDKSYSYEHEHRIVYFEFNTELSKREEYKIKEISSGKFICPYVSLLESTHEDKDDFFGSIHKITISPCIHNIPIDKTKYKNVLINYLKRKQTDYTNNESNTLSVESTNNKNCTTDINVLYSNLKKRW